MPVRGSRQDWALLRRRVGEKPRCRKSLSMCDARYAVWNSTAVELLGLAYPERPPFFLPVTVLYCRHVATYAQPIERSERAPRAPENAWDKISLFHDRAGSSEW